MIPHTSCGGVGYRFPQTSTWLKMPLERGVLPRETIFSKYDDAGVYGRLLGNEPAGRYGNRGLYERTVAR